MRHAPHVLLFLVATLAGCPGGNAGLGESCDSTSDCDSDLQCLGGSCQLRCARGPDCGDGYSCDADGICHLADGRTGDACTSEVACAPGLACQINGDAVDDAGHLLASCASPNRGRPSGATCAMDDDCRNGTCALGHCVDLCDETRDCAGGTACMTIPRVEAAGKPFVGCLPAQGNVIWSIPVNTPTDTIALPIPSAAHSASLVFTVDDPAQAVGAQELATPDGMVLYRKPCTPPGTMLEPCTPQQATEEFFSNLVRHMPEPGQSVLAMPTSPMDLQTGAYRVALGSFRANGTPGSAVPSVTAVVRMGSAVILDVHFHFLELDDHPCKAAFGNESFDANIARDSSAFQSDFIVALRQIFARGGIAIGGLTYDDVPAHPDLDALDIADVGSLLALGKYPDGINVFFVRSLSPVGLQAFGPSPGPGGIANTRQSGVVIGIDTLCYRTWPELARLTAHEMARYMGLPHNVELDPNWHDGIPDSDDSPNNLMFFSEKGGTELSPGQRDIITRSPVLR